MRNFLKIFGVVAVAGFALVAFDGSPAKAGGNCPVVRDGQGRPMVFMQARSQEHCNCLKRHWRNNPQRCNRRNPQYRAFQHHQQRGRGFSLRFGFSGGESHSREYRQR